MKKQKTVPKDIDKTIQLATIYSNDVELPRKKAMVKAKLRYRLRPTDNMLGPTYLHQVAWRPYHLLRVTGV